MTILKGTLFLALMAVMLMTAACGTNEKGPASVAQAWVNAVIEGESAITVLYTCRASAADYQMPNMVKDIMSNFIEAEIAGGVEFSRVLDFDVDIGGVTFNTVSQDEGVARVRAMGGMHLSILGMDQKIAVDDEFIMVYEDKRWKVCGSQSNE